jgi:hypothetical protein
VVLHTLITGLAEHPPTKGMVVVFVHAMLMLALHEPAPKVKVSAVGSSARRSEICGVTTGWAAAERAPTRIRAAKTRFIRSLG